MDTQLTRAARVQLARSVRRRYQAASSQAKEQILDEFIAVSCYHPKYAIHVLNAPGVDRPSKSPASAATNQRAESEHRRDRLQ